MNYDDYAQLDAVNFSTLKHMDSSPLHYWHAVKNRSADKDSFRLGRATHTAILEPARFADDYAVCELPTTGKGSRTARKAFKTANTHRTILDEGDYALALAMRDAVRSNPVAMKYLAAGQAEQTIRWTDPATGLACKARADWIADTGTIVDVKTTGSADPRRFGNDAARYFYHAQMAFYVDGLREAGNHRIGADIIPAVLIAVEKYPPHDVAVFALDEEEALYAGRETYREWLARVVECKSVNVWPGRFGAEKLLQLPAYVFDDDPDGIADGIQLEG